LSASSSAPRFPPAASSPALPSALPPAEADEAFEFASQTPGVFPLLTPPQPLGPSRPVVAWTSTLEAFERSANEVAARIVATAEGQAEARRRLGTKAPERHRLHKKKLMEVRACNADLPRATLNFHTTYN
jgi:hypothetical protein